MARPRPAHTTLLTGLLTAGAIGLAGAGSALGAPPAIDLTFDFVTPGTVVDAQLEGTGFTGVQANRDLDPADSGLLDLQTAAGILVVQSSPFDALSHDHINHLQSEFDGTQPHLVATVIRGPLQADAPFENAGIFVGPDEDNYVKIVAGQFPQGPAIQLAREEGGVLTEIAAPLVAGLPTAPTIELRLLVNPQLSLVTASYRVGDGPLTTVGTTSLGGLGSPVAKAGISHTHVHAEGALANAPFLIAYDRFLVQPLTLVPVVTRLPAPGATGVSTTANVVVELADALDPSTFDATDFLLTPTAGGSPVPARFISSPGFARFTLNPSTPLLTGTQYTASAAGDVMDRLGNPAAVSDRWTFTTQGLPPEDAGLPTINTRDPAPNATGVAPDGAIVVAFSRAMSVPSVTAAGAFTVRPSTAGPAVAGAITPSEENSVFSFDPTADLLPSTQYTVTIADTVTDAGGNRLGGTESWTFTTAAGPPPTALGRPVCVRVPARPRPPEGGGGEVTLSAAQLRINQRISQAAVRRANGVQNWLEAGIVDEDICGGALGREEFAPQVVIGAVSLEPKLPPTPRAVIPTPAAGQGPGSGPVTLSAAQLLINQRISQAAVRRINALQARFNAGLTGGDVLPGQVTTRALVPGLGITSAAPTPDAPAKTVTRIAPRQGGGSGRVSLSAVQLRINQRISQAAVRRVNALQDKIRRGLTGRDFQDGSLTAADIDPNAI